MHCHDIDEYSKPISELRVVTRLPTSFTSAALMHLSSLLPVSITWSVTVMQQTNIYLKTQRKCPVRKNILFFMHQLN